MFPTSPMKPYFRLIIAIFAIWWYILFFDVGNSTLWTEDSASSNEVRLLQGESTMNDDANTASDPIAAPNSTDGLPPPPPLLPSELNVAVFGTGDAYGAYLQDRSNEAYPFLLGAANVDNYAHFDYENLNFYSTCFTTSIAQEKQYHVLIVDFFLHYNQGLDILVRKLHQRFPNAQIILMKTWAPAMFRRKESETAEDSQSFHQWKQSVNLTSQSHVMEVIWALQNDTGYWYNPKGVNANNAIEAMGKDLGAYTFSFPVRETAKNTMIDYMGYFDWSTGHRLSKLGHEVMANSLLNFIAYVSPGPDALLANATFGPMPQGDSCHLWFQSGKPDVPYSDVSLKAIEVFKNVPKHKQRYALELTTAGWITVTNPFKETRTLYVSYLTTDSELIYPKVLVTVQDANISVTLDPFSLIAIKPTIHTKTTVVGSIPSGMFQVIFQELPGPQTSKKFGIVGILIGDDDESTVPLEYGFGESYGITG